jgi:streptomycin 3"-adenylyltransferase
MMPDLAVILTQLRLKSKTLYGPQPHDLLPIIPYPDFMCAMLHDVERLSLDLMNDTRNVLLTLARIWVTLETLSICSKAQAATWVMNHLPQTLQPVMLRAKSIYLGLEKEDWRDLQHLIRPCADHMIRNITAIASSIELKSSKSITIADDF